MNNQDRVQALQVLRQVFEKNLSLSQALPSSASSLTKALCYGVCRHYFRLEVLADSLMKKRPDDKDVWLILLLGLYQLYWQSQPQYAVVKETVDVLTKIRKIWAKGFVNAVLRNACREQAHLNKTLEQDSTWIYGHPSWLLALIQSSFPDTWEQILIANDRHPPMTLRVNRLHHTIQEYGSLLEQADIEYIKHETAAEGLILSQAIDVYALPKFKEGAISVQDAAAQQAASLMDLKPGLRVLDACCAPGGKTGHMLELESEIFCIAMDVDEKRLQRVHENLSRLQLQASCIQGDVLKPEDWWDGILFDRILLDAPCSALGVIRRHPDIKLLRSKEAIDVIVKLQAEMLRTLWPLLAPGGRLVYATCSILPEENTGQIQSFITNHQDCNVRMIDKPWGFWTGYGRQILPGDQNMDGFFYSVLEKCKQPSSI